MAGRGHEFASVFGFGVRNPLPAVMMLLHREIGGAVVAGADHGVAPATTVCMYDAGGPDMGRPAGLNGRADKLGPLRAG